MTDTLAPQRRCLPTRRRSMMQKVKVGPQSVYLCCGFYADGTLGEVFIDCSKAGSAFRSLLSSLAVSISIGLQYGIPLTIYLDALRELEFEPAGAVQGSASVASATSILDWVAQELEAVVKTAVQSSAEGPPTGEVVATREVAQPSSNGHSQAKEEGYTGETCTHCGSMRMKRNGPCLLCVSCGSTSGCS